MRIQIYSQRREMVLFRKQVEKYLSINKVEEMFFSSANDSFLSNFPILGLNACDFFMWVDVNLKVSLIVCHYLFKIMKFVYFLGSFSQCLYHFCFLFWILFAALLQISIVVDQTSSHLGSELCSFLSTSVLNVIYMWTQFRVIISVTPYNRRVIRL